MASYFEWKKTNHDYELEEAFKLFYDKINNLSEDDGK